ncbi:MAG: aldo/keto reductase [Eubacteriales bacterium]|nr:aldo/keto reductase [Eubacteriales bacterium]
MNYVTLGKTGLKVSKIGLGGIPIQKSSAQEVKELVKTLSEKGVNYIDSARGYTVSEQLLGEALEGIRDKFVLATKSMSRTKEAMAKDIEISLENFRTDYIDLYQVHNPSMEDMDKVEGEGGALEALLEAKAAGRIGHIGLTAHSLQVFEHALTLDWVETIMFPYNIVESQGEELMKACSERNVGFIAMKPLAGGAIEDASLALRYICSNPDVTIVIPGMYSLKEAEENISAVEKDEPLNEKDAEKIAAVREQLGENFCRRCNYCQPCTVGINISGVFLFAGYLQRYGLGEWGSSRYQTLKVRPEECVECGECESRCPYHLPIREMLKKCAKDFRDFEASRK